MKTNVAPKQLKIAVLTSNYNKSGGGAERYCVELTERLANIHKVHVFSQFNNEHSNNISFHSIPKWIKRPSFINRFLFAWFAMRKTNKQFDIVYSHVLSPYADIYTLHVSCIKTKWTQTRGVKKFMLWAITLLSLRKMVYLWMEHKQMQNLPTRHFISVSEYLSNNILANYPKLDGHISIAHPGIKINPSDDQQVTQLRSKFRKDYNISIGSYLLLFIAHDFKRKGLPAIIKALEKLNNDNIHIVIAGDGNPQKIKINTSTVRTNTHFIGIVKNMEKLYPVADTLIHPTLGDTYGMVVSEAMAHKLSVIVSSSQYCGFSEHLNAKEAVFLKNPTDVNEIAKCISQLYTNPDLRTNISKLGYEKVKHITWSKTLDKTLAVINMISQRKITQITL